MNFTDRTLVHLATPARRATLFDEVALEQIASAAYHADRLVLEGPWSAAFTTLQLGLVLDQPVTGDFRWLSGGHQEAQLHLARALNGAELAVDGFWRGHVIGRGVPATGRVSELALRSPRLDDIDATLEASPAGLPDDPAARETARRELLLDRIRSGAADPDALTPATIDRWLAEIGAESLGEALEERPETLPPLLGRLGFETIGPADPTPVRLPVAASLLVRDPLKNAGGLAQVLRESKAVQERMADGGLELAEERGLPQRDLPLVVWLVPAEWFDDDDWPGGEGAADPTAARALRRRAAGVWLALEGIGLAAIEGAA